MTDDIGAPLGRKKKRFGGASFNIGALRAALPRLPWARGMLAILFLALAVAVFRVTFFDDNSGGRPIVSQPISSTKDNNPVAQVAVNEAQGNQIVSDAPTPDVQVVDGSGNVIQSESLPETPAELQRDEFDLYVDLLEEAKYGNIPRISSVGLRPFEAYARPSISPASADGKPLVAIIVTGLGLDDTATIDFVDRLPENVTLAFAPYGPTLDRLALMSRRQGHELLLEVPMEPFDYPQSDPGPHTLLTNQPARTNLDNMFWLMSRMGGYVGIMNNLGARFTSSAADLTPIIEELGTRGLGYVDDNSSNRSLSRQLADANQVPFARATMMLDFNPSRAAILENLDELARRARQNGTAIGIVSALPVSVGAIVSWTATLEELGVELVPVSALMKDE